MRPFNEFNWRWAGAMVAVAAFFAWADHTAFHRGLRRYASGSVWTVG